MKKMMTQIGHEPTHNIIDIAWTAYATVALFTLWIKLMVI